MLHPQRLLPLHFLRTTLALASFAPTIFAPVNFRSAPSLEVLAGGHLSLWIHCALSSSGVPALSLLAFSRVPAPRCFQRVSCTVSAPWPLQPGACAPEPPALAFVDEGQPKSTDHENNVERKPPINTYVGEGKVYGTLAEVLAWQGVG